MPRKPKKTAKKTTTKASGKTTKLDQMSQAHGKKEEEYEPTTLDQIWGDDGMGKYKTLDNGEYEQQIRAMGKSELQMHATQVGLIPVDNRETLTARLIKEFNRYVASYTVPAQSKKKPSSVSNKAMKILKEGS